MELRLAVDGRTLKDLTLAEIIGHNMQSRRVKWFDRYRGYGFIVPDCGGPDLFVHVTALNTAGIGHLEEGWPIRFEVSRRGEKQRAVGLQVVNR